MTRAPAEEYAMHKPLRRSALAAVATLSFLMFLPNLSRAGVAIYVDDQAGFGAASSGLVLAGMEDWSSSTLAANQLAHFADPLAPGVSNGPFPGGTNPATGMTVQSNTLGGNPTVPSPGGGLANASEGFLGTPDDQVSSDLVDTSFDMIFAIAGTDAVSFTPLIFDQVGSGNAGTATIRVYDSSNALLGSVQDIPVAGFTNPTTFVGIVTTGGDAIGRINVFATSTNDRFAGADNIAVYTTGSTPVSGMSWGRVKALYR